MLADDLAFSTHAAVIAEFGRRFAHTDRVPRRLHRYLIDAEAQRVKGDYDPVDSFTQADAARHIANAEEFLEASERILGSPLINQKSNTP